MNVQTAMDTYERGQVFTPALPPGAEKKPTNEEMEEYVGGGKR